MKSLVACLALIASTTAVADEDFEPLQMEDGSRTWRFVLNGMPTPQESYILDAIRLAIGRSLFCPSGWEITGREKKMLTITVITGRCRAVAGIAVPTQ